MARRHEEDPGLPIKLHPCSNAEYDPPPATPLVREAARRAREACEGNARLTGMSRRRFLLSGAGAATTLAVLAACSSEAGKTGGTYAVPTETTLEPEAASEVLGGDAQFVMDVQGHLLEYDLDTPVPEQWFGAGFPQAACDSDDPRACFSTEHFLDEVFVRSDTTMAVLSAIPVAGPQAPLSPEVMAAALRVADRLCGEGRVLMQGHAVPNAGPPEEALAAMEDVAARYPIVAWKAYTHASGPGWYLDDHDPAAPQLGRPFIEHALALGTPILAVHKGFSGGSPFASPVDIGPAAAAFPEARFAVYHSGYEAGVAEGPYDEATRDEGVNRLVSSVLDADLAPGSNVYAELGSTWRSVMGDVDSAAHVLGKLLLHVGEDNVLWGTDSIWYGSPQDQITAFRAFEISPELQERYGYPALTPAVKDKVLGLNAARLYRIDPAAVAACRPSPAEAEELRVGLPGAANATFGPTTPAAARAHRARFGWF